MARIIFTNNVGILNKWTKRNIESGFSEYNSIFSEPFSMVVHKKRVKKIENLFQSENGDFCSAVGTFIYKGEFGKTALIKCYKDFDEDIEKIRDNSLGNYLLAIKKCDKIRLFVDRNQIFRVYYFKKGDTFLLANGLYEIGCVLDSIEINEFVFLEETMLMGSIGQEAIFKNVFRLFGHQYIEIDLRNLETSFSLKDLPYTRERRDLSHSSLDSIVNDYVNIVKPRFEIIAKVFGENIRLHQTGGLDSRTIFAGLMSVGCKPKIMYGEGNSVLTNTKNEDLSINAIYAKKFGLDFYKMNWKDNYVQSIQEWPELLKRYGFNFSIYGGNRSFFREYEGLIPDYPDFMECGYFLENLRLREWADTEIEDSISMKDFINRYLLGGAYGNFSAGEGVYSNITKFRKYLTEKYIRFANLYGIPLEKGITKENFDEVRWIHARNCDSRMVNFLNDFAPSISLFSVFGLHEFPFDVPARYRRNAQFQLMFIHKLFPQALEVPIFSHCQKQRFNSNTFTIQAQHTKSEMIKHFLKNRVCNDHFYNLLKSLYHPCFKNKISSEREYNSLKEDLINILTNQDRRFVGFLDPNDFSGDIRFLMNYVQYVYGLSSLINSDS